MINLNNKERMLLQDEKEHEELCVNKYKQAAEKASCPNLKSLFNQLEQQEQQHLNSINQLLSGTVPSTGGQQNQQNSQSQQNMQTQGNILKNNINVNPQIPSYNQEDKILCTDLLSTEKYVSSTYNTAIFEFRDENVRNVLNHIQKEEQEHGKKIYDYMASHGMYNQQ